MWARAATWKRSEVIRTRIIIMVVLGTFLLRRSGYVRKRTYLPNPLAAAGLVRGPAAVRDIVPRTIFNNKITGPRPPAPGWKMMYYSVVLGGKLHLRVTTMAQRLIKDAGGFDRYIYYTSDEELKSELALTLKRRMQSLVATHPTAEPPPLDKRNPKPLPRKLPLDIKRVEVVQTIKYQFLG